MTGIRRAQHVLKLKTENKKLPGYISGQFFFMIYLDAIAACAAASLAIGTRNGEQLT